MSAINRRTFPALLGAAVLSRPLAARAQQSAMPIGYLDSQSPGAFTDLVLPAIRQGLKETGYVEGETLAIVYRWAETQIDRLPALAAELVGRRVAGRHWRRPSCGGCSQGGNQDDPRRLRCRRRPVKLGLVASLARPGGNLIRERAGGETAGAVARTGARGRSGRRARRSDLPLTENQVREAHSAARTMGLQIQILNASTSARNQRGLRDASRAFRRPLRRRQSLFRNRRVQLALLARRHGIPRCTERVCLPKPAG
jgi:putative ABC transport system substrate-binding protein